MEQVKKIRCPGCMELIDAGADKCPLCGWIQGQDTPYALHMRVGSVLKNRYEIGRSLGYGSFGVTYLAWDRLLRHKVAIKEYLPSEYATRVAESADLILPDSENQRAKFERGMTRFHQEAEKLAKLGHIDGVVYIYDTFEEHNTAYIVMEYLQGQTLASYLEERGVLSEQETLDLMLPLLQSLEDVHAKGIIHRDISPENIFIAEDSAGGRKVKLIDFGAARFATSSHSKSLTVLLRPGYSPEEQYRSSGEQGPHTDIYALAAVMYQMVTGVVPPDALERRTGIERKNRDLLKEPSEYNKDLSYNFEMALMNALNVKIEDRTPNAEEFVAELISYEKVKRRGSSIKRIDFMKWPLWAKIGVPAAGAGAVALALILFLVVIPNLAGSDSWMMQEGYVRVPNYISQNLSAAETDAEERGLVLEVAEPEYTDTAEPDTVIRQGTQDGYIVKKNSVVDLTVCMEQGKFCLPDLTGMALSEVRTLLEDCMGMNVTVEESAQPGLAQGCVIAQSLAAYTEVDFGADITLTCTPSAEPAALSADATIPDLTGKTLEEAMDTLDQAGLVMLVSKRTFSKDCTQETVKEQRVGEVVGAVAVVLDTPWRTFSMPNLNMKNQALAEQLLAYMGIQPTITEEYSDLIKQGKVLAQSVEVGSVIEPGAAVELTVSQGSKPFQMPNVTGMTEDAAKAALSELKLAVSVEYTYDENVAEGAVISQDIAEGSDVTRGTEIKLVVCSHDALVTVEGVSGKNFDEAKSTLEAQGLSVQKNEVYSSVYESGTVIEQLPAAGSMQVAGTTVVLTVSKGEDPAVVKQRQEAERQEQENGGARTWHWSDWSTSVPAGTESEHRTEYSYRTYETTTSNEASMPGWTQTSASTSWGSWGAWSAWSETAVARSDSTDVESKTQYRYQDLETGSGQSVPSGWTETGSSQSWGSWGSWSEWSETNPGGNTDSREVEQRTVYIYYYFLCQHCGSHNPYWNTCSNCGATDGDMMRDRRHLYSTTSYDNAGLQSYGNGKYITYAFDDGPWFKWDDDTNVRTQYRYRERQMVTTYTYCRWGNWSGWSDAVYSESSTRQVETRTVYRYRTRSQVYTYTYERSSEWSEYSTTPVANSAGIEVRTRTQYRYKIYD